MSFVDIFFPFVSFFVALHGPPSSLFQPLWSPFADNSFRLLSLLQNSLGSGIYCREELLSLGARASRPHKTWQGRGDWLHRVGRFTRRLTLEQRLDKYAGGTPALPGGNPWLARCRSLSRALFCRSILPPSHARLRILQKAPLPNLWRIPLDSPPTPSWPFVFLRVPSWITLFPCWTV